MVLWPMHTESIIQPIQEDFGRTRYRIAWSTVGSFHQTSNVSCKTSCNLLLKSPRTRSSINNSALFASSRTAKPPTQRKIVRCSGLVLPAPSSCIWNADALPLRSEGHVERWAEEYHIMHVAISRSPKIWYNGVARDPQFSRSSPTPDQFFTNPLSWPLSYAPPFITRSISSYPESTSGWDPFRSCLSSLPCLVSCELRSKRIRRLLRRTPR